MSVQTDNTTEQPESLVLERLEAAAADVFDANGVPVKIGRQYRRVKAATAGYNADEHTVELTLTSEEPVERYFGVEILSHKKGAIRTDRLENGISLLYNHNYDKLIGRSLSYKAPDGGPLSLLCKFGPSAFSQEREAEVAAGILKDTSGGYQVFEWEITEDKNGNRKYEGVDWSPIEGSLVTVPADPTVGVGRGMPVKYTLRKLGEDGEPVSVKRFAFDPGLNRSVEMDLDTFMRSADADDEDDDPEDEPEEEAERSLEAPAAIPAPAPGSAPDTTTIPEQQRTNTMAAPAVANPNPPAPIPVVDVAAQEEQRKAGLRSLHTAYPNFFDERQLKAAEALDTPLGRVKDAIFDAIAAESRAADVSTLSDNILGEKGKRSYSMLRAIRYAINQAKPGTFSAKDADAGFEREHDADLRKRLSDLGAPAGFGSGLLIPGNLPFDDAGAERAARQFGRRSFTAGSTTGGNVINTVTQADYIDLLRARNRLMALGAQTLSGVHGLFRIPRQTATAQSTWLAELGTATNSDLTADFITASPRRNSIMGSYTMEMLAQSAPDVEAWVRRDQILSKATTREVVGFSGTGGTMPTGLFNLSGIAAILTGTTRAANGTVTAGAGGVPLTYVDCNNFESAISTANADTGTMGWALTPRVRAALRSTPKFPNGLSDPIWPTTSTMNPDGLQEGPLGYMAGVTTNVPTGFTVNSVNNLHGGAFGVWSSMVYVEWGISELIMDPYTGAKQALFNVIEHELLDIMFRHPEQFAVTQSILPS